MTARDGLLRSGGGSRPVTPIELFFDLVYVFAVTQLAHLLLAHLTVGGALQALLLLLAVWWAWVYTSWITSWFDPERTPVRLLLLAIMLVSLLMSASIPGAFGDQALLFAIAYVLIQVGRTVFLLVALGPRHELTPNFRRVLSWFAVSMVFWLTGALAGGAAQVVLWLLAVAIEYLAPMVGFHTPRLGRSDTRQWAIDGGHLAERCQLFVIVALGESILITGATAAGLKVTVANVIAFVVAFIGSAALWWVYFDRTAEAGSRAIAAAEDPGRFARSAYNYFHVIMIAGIILTAVGDELSITHPAHHADLAVAATVLAGPALFLLGSALFHRSLTGRLSRARLGAVGALVLAAALVPLATTVALAGVAAAVVVAVGVWEATESRPARPERV